jgi:hypothetical protein
MSDLRVKLISEESHHYVVSDDDRRQPHAGELRVPWRHPLIENHRWQSCTVYSVLHLRTLVTDLRRGGADNGDRKTTTAKRE